MKNLLSFSIAIVMSGLALSQATFIVDPPSSSAGEIDLVDIADAVDDWGVADLNVPANAVAGTMCFVDDGTTADSLGCNPLVNGASINGKIAVVYRGDCEFGTKALQAQNEGAIAVIIISNTDVTAFNMLGATDGPSVTIPVVMISSSNGELLKNDIETCNVTAFIGNKNGYYSNDLGLRPVDVLRARQFATPSRLALNASEFSVNVGSWIHNYGQNDQTNVTLSCAITSPTSGSTYNETSNFIANIPSGDSVFVALNDWFLASYPEEYYTMVYTIASDSADNASFDNSLNADFMITDNKYAVSRIDSLTKDPMDMVHFQPANFSSSFHQCVHFVDPNASRLLAKGVTFDAISATGTTLDGEIITVEAYIWEDLITDINDPNFTLNSLNNITIGEYEYDTDDQDIAVTADFDEPFQMVDNQHYLFCATSLSQNVFLGFDNADHIDYSENIVASGHIVEAIGYDGNWFALGFTDATVAITFNTTEVAGIENEEQILETTAFPNPAADEIKIPLTHIEGTSAQLTIFDLTGRAVSLQNISLNANLVSVDVSSILNGTYVFMLSSDSGKIDTFNVVVSR